MTAREHCARPESGCLRNVNGSCACGCVDCNEARAKFEGNARELATLSAPKDPEHHSLGSGDFSIGSNVWPGTSKLIEEMGELQQVLGKLIAVHGADKHWDGNLRQRLIEELGDVSAAMTFFMTHNLSLEDIGRAHVRAEEKVERFCEWHNNPTRP